MEIMCLLAMEERCYWLVAFRIKMLSRSGTELFGTLKNFSSKLAQS